MISTLETKKKRIEGMINSIKIIKSLSKLPENTLYAFANIDQSKIYRKNSFRSYFEESITEGFNETDINSEEYQMYVYFVYSIVAIGLLSNHPKESAIVQDTINDAYQFMLNMPMSDAEITEEVSEKEFSEGFSEIITEFVNDDDLKDLFEFSNGLNSGEYIIQAVNLFCDKRKSSTIINR